MAGSLTNSGEVIALKAVTDVVELALRTSTPSDTSDGTEVSGGGYKRQSVKFDVSSGNPSKATNSDQIEFPTANADWGKVTYATLHQTSGDKSTTAFMQLVDPNDTSKALPQDVVSGNIVRFPKGSIVIQLD